MRISDWSSDVCSSDLIIPGHRKQLQKRQQLLCGGIARDTLYHRLGFAVLGDNQRWRSRFEVTDDIGAVRLQIANRLDSRFDAHDNLQSKFSPNIDRFRVHAISVETTRSEEHTSELQSLMRISYA